MTENYPPTPFRATITTKGEPHQTLTGEVEYCDVEGVYKTFDFYIDAASDVSTFTVADWSITPEVSVPTKPGAVIRAANGALFALSVHGMWRHLSSGSSVASLPDEYLAGILRNGGRVLFEGYDEEVEK